jgi:hypothetical protein
MSCRCHPQNRVGRHDRRDLVQRRTSKTMSTHRQATPLTIHQPQPSTAELGSQDAILLHQISDHVLLTSTEPTGESREEDLKRGNGINHGGASLPRGVGRILGHYAGRISPGHTLVVRS